MDHTQMNSAHHRALIVDDHPMMAEALSFALSDARLFDEIEIVRSLKEARTRLDAAPGYALVLLDLHMSDTNGVEGIHVMREHYPDLPLIIFTADDSVETIRLAFESGVRGYITKDSPREVVIGAVNLVLAGDNYIPRHAAPGLGLDIAAPTPNPSNHLAPKPRETINLSPRQLQVLGYLLLGMPNKVIATRLGMAEGTVKTHLNTVYRVLGARNRVHAILRARDLGLMEESLRLLPEGANSTQLRAWERQ
jgi:DNA-binding NarL/FixJ family response regulator